jgi:hypothetical protein
MSYFFARSQIQLRWTFAGGRFPEGRFPREGASIRVDMKDPKARFAPASAAVFDYRYARAKAGNEAANNEV